MKSKAVKSAEDNRVSRQMVLDAELSSHERNRMGQYATPTQLAQQIASVALQAHSARKIRFLEPSLGTGAFYSALLHQIGRKHVDAAYGVELDPRFVRAACQLWEASGLQVEQADFTKLQEPTNGDRYNLILANPPYVRHHHLSPQDKVRLQKAGQAQTSAKVSGLTGLYVYFMLLAHPWMSEGAIAAWLVPTEWMDVNYGQALRSYLTSKVSLIRVHRFNANDIQFGDALVSSSVIFLRNSSPPSDHKIEFTSSELLEPQKRELVPLRTLQNSRKWSPLFNPDKGRSRKSPQKDVALGDLVKVSRGIATGSNKYFIKTRDEFESLGIPDQFLRPVLPSSRYLDCPVIEAEDDGYPTLPQSLALLDCDLLFDELMTDYPRLATYLDSEEGRKVRQGYLASRRTPWYSQEKRKPAPIVATYMGRGRQGADPFRFFWNKSDAIGTNVYLLLYPKGELAKLIMNQPEKAGLIRDFLASRTKDELARQGRVYGGGLHKLEPKELERLDAIELVQQLGLKPMATQLALAI